MSGTNVLSGGGRTELVLRSTRRLVRRGKAQRRWSVLNLRIGIVIVGLVLLASFLEPVLGLPSPDKPNYAAILLSPRAGHWFGTDSLGRDVFARTLAAGRLDLRVAVTLTAISLSIGVPLGAAAGFFRGFVDTVIMRVADVVMAFPGLVLILAIVAIVGPGVLGLYIGVTLTGWAFYARLTRAEMLAIREREYVLAGRTLGFSDRRVLIRHALPNTWKPALTLSAADMIGNVGLLAGLSFLGLGVQEPTPEWGAIIASGEPYLLSAWWITTLPGLVLVAVGVGLALISDSGAELLGVRRESKP